MTARSRRGRRLFAAACLALGALPAVAQTDDDPTDDHAERDRRYLERRSEPRPAPAGATDPSTAEQQERYLAFVDELIRDRNHRAADGEHYRIQTDDPRVDAAAVVDLLERFRTFFDAGWSARMELEPYDARSRVFLFWSYHKYNKLLGADFSRSVARPKGHYGSGFDAITLHTDSDSPGDLADTVIHEATHQLMDRRIAWSSAGQPTWLAEGLAGYYGYMLMEAEGGFVHDRVGAKEINLFREGKTPAPTQAEVRVRVFREIMKRERSADSVYGLLLALGPAEFYAGDSNFHYAASWLLVHWLFEGDSGAHADAFVDWIRQAAAGTAESRDLPAAVGASLEELDAAVGAWAKQLKAR